VARNAKEPPAFPTPYTKLSRQAPRNRMDPEWYSGSTESIF
jgi:hypothetical protein